MKCPICSSKQIKFIDNFKPYTDTPWIFPVYDCNHCLSRFALRDNGINYHELLHEDHSTNNYQHHYNLAEKVADFIARNDIRSCEEYLRKSHYMHDKIIDFIDEHSHNEQLSVLELGCSSGYLTAFLNAKGIKTYGVDISETAINKAKRIFPQYAEQYSLEPLQSSYSIVFHKGLLSCVDDPVGFVEHNLKLLTPGGRLIFNISNVNNARKFNHLWLSTPPPDVVNLFHDRAIDFLVKDRSKYSVEIEKNSDYFLLFKRYWNILRGKPFEHYPRTFINKRDITSESAISGSKIAITKIIGMITYGMVKARILTPIYDDFGTLIKIHRTS